MEAGFSSETFVSTYKTTRNQHPENHKTFLVTIKRNKVLCVDKKKYDKKKSTIEWAINGKRR
jgi:hypothetical protein